MSHITQSHNPRKQGVTQEPVTRNDIFLLSAILTWPVCGHSSICLHADLEPGCPTAGQASFLQTVWNPMKSKPTEVMVKTKHNRNCHLTGHNSQSEKEPACLIVAHLHICLQISHCKANVWGIFGWLLVVNFRIYTRFLVLSSDYKSIYVLVT